MGRSPECHPDRKHQAFGLCMPCYQRDRRAGPDWLARNREASRKWREANRELARSRVAQFKASNPAQWAIYQRRHSLKKRYGLTIERWFELYQSQDGRCACCGKPIEPDKMRVDHDHACCPSDVTCGQCLRGLVCNECNLGIGHLGDTIEGVRKALDYLERTKNGIVRYPASSATSEGSRAKVGQALD